MNRLANLHSSSPPNSQLDSNESKRLELILAMKRQNFEAAVSIARSVLSTDQPAFDLELTATLSSLYSKISIDATIKKLYGLYFASLNKVDKDQYRLGIHVLTIILLSAAWLSLPRTCRNFKFGVGAETKLYF
jgi:hypothetical protein